MRLYNAGLQKIVICHTNCRCQADRQGPWTSCFSNFAMHSAGSVRVGMEILSSLDISRDVTINRCISESSMSQIFSMHRCSFWASMHRCNFCGIDASQKIHLGPHGCRVIKFCSQCRSQYFVMSSAMAALQ